MCINTVAFPEIWLVRPEPTLALLPTCNLHLCACTLNQRDFDMFAQSTSRTRFRISLLSIFHHCEPNCRSRGTTLHLHRCSWVWLIRPLPELQRHLRSINRVAKVDNQKKSRSSDPEFSTAKHRRLYSAGLHPTSAIPLLLRHSSKSKNLVY